MNGDMNRVTPAAAPQGTQREFEQAQAAALTNAAQNGLYSRQEHDACGVGFVAHLKGRKAHSIVTQGLKILENLDHRGAVGADPLMGDGAGILIQIPHEFYAAQMLEQG